MKLEDFQAGHYVKQFEYMSFSPSRINIEWFWESPEINVLLEKANYALSVMKQPVIKDWASQPLMKQSISLREDGLSMDCIKSWKLPTAIGLCVHDTQSGTQKRSKTGCLVIW